MANYVSALTGAAMDDALQQMNNRVPEGWAVGERDGVPVGEESLYYHNNAKYYAEQAQAQAESAEESAESASQVAQETADAVIAQAFVQESAEVGSIVTIDDGADNIPLKDLKANLAINQPLHGQANPYPAGGGKNLLPITLAGIKTLNTSGTWSGNAYTYNGVVFTINSDNAGNITGINANGTANGGNASLVLIDNFSNYSNGDILNGCPSGGATNTYKLSFFGSGASIEDIGAGRTINSTTLTTVAIIVYSGVNISNKVFYPMIRLATDTDATFAPYSNICPIYPVTEAEIIRNGVNQWDEQWEVGGINDTTGEKITVSTQIRSMNYLPCLPSTAYYIKSPYSIYVYYYDSDKSFLSRANNGGYDVKSKTVTTPSNVAYMLFKVQKTAGEVTYNNDISINYPSTDHDYHSGAGNAQYLVNIGINQWDEEWELGKYNNTTGEKVDATNLIRCKNRIAVNPSTAYYFKMDGSFGASLYYYDSTGAYISTEALNRGNIAFTTPSNAYYVTFNVSSAYGTTYNHNISINFPSHFTSYYPYTGNVVYGGELDVTTGALTSKYGMVDLGSLTWTYDSTNLLFKATMLSPVSPNACFCSSYAYSPYTIGASRADKTINAGKPYFDSSNRAITVKDTAYTDPAVFKTAMSGVQLVYELATPITIQLTPTEVDTLRGDNVIWADCGDITNCEYRADLKLYIDKVVG